MHHICPYSVQEQQKGEHQGEGATIAPTQAVMQFDQAVRQAGAHIGAA